MSRTNHVAESYWCCSFNALDKAHQHPVMLEAKTEPIQEYGEKEGLGFFLSFANATVLDTEQGLVLMDCGDYPHGKEIYEELEKWRPNKPIHTVIYTHGHIDHCMGVRYMEKAQKAKGKGGIRVVGHELVANRFDRYKITKGYNAAINLRQFQTETSWPSTYRYPDLYYKTSLDLEIGKEKLQLFHDKGETDDSTWIWIPERKALCAGDLFIWATPNCGNPQKVQRYPVEWAIALRKMMALEPEFFFPGHGPPIIGKERIRQALGDTATFLESICRQTLEGINRGESLNQILHSVKFDKALMAKPYLRPVYDDPRFIVRNLWRRYAGWWDFDPAHLFPVADAALGKEIVQLAGGVDKVLQRARDAISRSEIYLAVQLVQYALNAEPQNPAVREVAIRVMKTAENSETSSMARNIFRSSWTNSQKVLDGLKPKL